MTIHVFRVWLQPHPALGFEPDEEVWRDIEIGGSHTLAMFHEAIFEAFERWESHTYEFITRDENGIALRSYVHPMLYRRNRQSASGLAPEGECRHNITQN